MKNYLLMMVGAVAVFLGIAPTASAAKPDIGISFDLAPSTSAPAKAIVPDESEVKAPTSAKPLPLPAQAAIVPIGSAQTKLPPPPKISPLTASSSNEDGRQREVGSGDAPPQTVASAPSALQFEATAPRSAPQSNQAATAPATAPDPAAEAKPIDIEPATSSSQPPQELQALFHGNDNSLVARAVGSAEGTRTPDGGHTWAYKGHTDPGNQAWNLGSFSYQHGASSPAEADRKQLQRLMNQAQTLRSHAAAQGVSLSLEAELNGIDLANQSPRAALSTGGYIDRLKQAQDMGLQGSDAVLWARTRAFLDPDTSRWNAPGLGNTVDSITADQERRRAAIARAIDQPQIASAQIPAEAPTQSATPPTPRREEKAVDQESIANMIISLDLPPT